MTRIALVLLRLSAASEVLRVGYLVGSYRQVGACLLVSGGGLEVFMAVG